MHHRWFYNHQQIIVHTHQFWLKPLRFVECVHLHIYSPVPIETCLVVSPELELVFCLTVTPESITASIGTHPMPTLAYQHTESTTWEMSYSIKVWKVIPLELTCFSLISLHLRHLSCFICKAPNKRFALGDWKSLEWISDLWSLLYPDSTEFRTGKSLELSSVPAHFLKEHHETQLFPDWHDHVRLLFWLATLPASTSVIVTKLFLMSNFISNKLGHNFNKSSQII